MKPLRLKLCAFGPFVEEQTIDFEKLSENGIFLIKGETGSGKTTIFDAMTFALYGGGSGTAESSRTGRNDFDQWRCQQADDSVDTFVDLEFSSGGKVYYFKRILKKAKKNFNATYEAGEVLPNGNRVGFFNNPKASDLNKKAKDIVGLSKDQFRQVVILPQGQFERFLTAGSDEKSHILEKIFGAETWDTYANRYYENAKAKYDALCAEKDSVEASLAEEEAADLAALKLKIDVLQRRHQDTEREHAAFEGERKLRELNSDYALAEKFAQLSKAENHNKMLLSRAEAMSAQKTIYSNAENAEKLRLPLADAEAAQAELQTRRKAFESFKAQAEKALAVQREARQARARHDECSPVQQIQQNIGLLEARKPYYASFYELQKGCCAASKKYNDALNIRSSVMEQFCRARDDAGKKLAEYNSAAEQAKKCRNVYYTGIYGEIAAQLNSGTPCPVCGSTVHPAPAEKLPDGVSKSDVESSEKKAGKALDCWNRSESLRQDLEKRLHDADDSLASASAQYNEAKAKLDAASGQLLSGIPDMQALTQQIHALNTSLNAYEQEGLTLQSQLDHANGQLADLCGKQDAAERELQAASDKAMHCAVELEELMRAGGYSGTEQVKGLLMSYGDRTKLYETLVKYDNDLANSARELSVLSDALSGITPPDESGFEARRISIAKEQTDYDKETAVIKESIGRLNDKYEKLRAKEEHYKSELISAEADLKFAKSLRGDTGIGLSRYVLGIMFSQVLGEANRMLSKVHGGRYTLYKTTEKGEGNKRGLELKVHDSRSPEKEGRSVAMLSGGEKFLVSLALSIGLSATAQKTGVRIEALFIDEGFGSLDGRSISDAMDVLDSVRRSRGTIGIISHVAVLEENIPSQLEVIKGKSGNSIRMV